MRIDLPQCGFHYCRFQFDGNCTSTGKYEKCEYRCLSEQIGPERKKGKWIVDGEKYEAITCVCSICGRTMTTPKRDRASYCWNCGSYNGGEEK